MLPRAVLGGGIRSAAAYASRPRARACALPPALAESAADARRQSAHAYAHSEAAAAAGQAQHAPQPLSVNYHFLRACNYRCGFCFHTAKSSAIARADDAKAALRMLADAGMRKLNFAGGEPFLKAELLGELVRYTKEDLRLESVSIVSNGSRVTPQWMARFGRHLDALAVSCDSFSRDTNAAIGRADAKGSDHVAAVRAAAALCREHGVPFKMNTVVNALNKGEDMNGPLAELAPFRWKVFQCLTLSGENWGQKAKRDASAFEVTSAEFEAFLERHRPLHASRMVPESNEDMQNSYLILDEELRFLNCRAGAKEPGPPLLQVGVSAALAAAGFDHGRFLARGGVYEWSRGRGGLQAH